MAKPLEIENEVRGHRLRLGWSQQELAARSGLSRTGLGAIEAGRLIPSTAAALALAAALGCRVEDLFRLRRDAPAGPEWAWQPQSPSGRYWHAEIGGRTVLYPVEASPLGVTPHDGICRDGVAAPSGRFDPQQTLVLSCCDPAVGLLAGELARSAGIRLLVLARSSRAALGLLGAGVVHVAGIHLATADDSGNEVAVGEVVGAGFTLLRLANWEEGVASAPARQVASVGAAVRSNLRWVGREVGSGARLCQDELLEGHCPPRRTAADHRGVAEAIRCGWADIGVCLRLAAEEAGLDFVGLRRESYDLCVPVALEGDARIQALIAAVQSPSFRRVLGELPGYDCSETGAMRQV